MNKYFIGIDIGSTCAKTVVMNHEKEILHRFLQPTGWSSVDTAKQIQETLMEKGILPEESVVVCNRIRSCLCSLCCKMRHRNYLPCKRSLLYS